MSLKKVLLGLVAFGLSSVALADMIDDFEAGPVVGLQAGYGRIDEGNGIDRWANDGVYNLFADGTRNKDIKRWNFVGRAYLGYNFLPYFGAEVGYDYFSREKYSVSGINLLSAKSLEARVRTIAFDVMGRLSLPMVLVGDDFDGYSVFVRGGVAYLSTRISGAFSGAYFPSTLTAGGQTFDYSTHSFRPIGGAGISYNFIDNFAVEAAWTAIWGKNSIGFAPVPLSAANPTATVEATNLDRAVPFSNAFTIGLSYKFTDF